MKDAGAQLAILLAVGVFASLLLVRSLWDSSDEIDVNFDELKKQETEK